jgi:flagellar hook-associated protein 3 FlgL
MTELQGHFSNGVSALNTRHAGKYLFAGGQVDTPPVSAKQLSDLTAPLTVIADFFHNDDYIDKARVDETTTLNVGQLADDLGTPMLTAYKDLQAFEEGGAGPFSGKLTAAQRTFLESQIAVWSSVHSDLVTAAAKNGAVQTQLDSVKTSMTARQTTIQGMIGDVSNADLAKAASALTQAQQSLQASSQVFLALKGASLLNVLR